MEQIERGQGIFMFRNEKEIQNTIGG